MQVLLCTLRWTQDGKLNRFFKMTIGLCVMFLAARSPVDILQFRDIIHSSQVLENCTLVLELEMKVHPKVRNHGEGPY